MDAVILSGNSSRNRLWGEEAGKKVRTFFTNTYVHPYAHWDNGGEFIDIPLELKRLKEHIPANRPYVIIAKSIGTVLTMHLALKKKNSPVKCLFFGIPVDWCHTNNIDIDSVSKNFKVPSFIVQNKEDPISSALSVRTYLEKQHFENYTFHETIGATHDYNDFKLVEKLARDFLLK